MSTVTEEVLCVKLCGLKEEMTLPWCLLCRYIKIKFTGAGMDLCTMKRARLAIVVVYIIVPVICLPNFFTTIIERHSEAESAYQLATNKSAEIWTLNFALHTPSDRLVYGLNFWMQAVIAKLLPCVILSVVSVLIIRRMRETDFKSRSLRVRAHKYRRRGSSAREHKTNSTTLMLLAVVLLFIVTEFPQGILNLLSGVLPYFVHEVYAQLGDLLDIAALTNNCVNFILYCSMSQQFRTTFLRLFVSR
jgi:G protein-coupled receptor 139